MVVGVVAAAFVLAVFGPPLVRSATLLAAGGLIGPSMPVGAPFRNSKQAKMDGSDCVTVLGVRNKNYRPAALQISLRCMSMFEVSIALLA